MKANAIAQLVLLFMIQWLSIAVIILNASALNLSKDSNGGLIMALETGPQDYTLLIMGALSMFAVSLLLCLYLQNLFRLMKKEITTPPRHILYTEAVLAFIIVALWTPAVIIILHHFKASSSCQPSEVINSLSTKISFGENRLKPTACHLVYATVTLAFITIFVWFMVLIISIYALMSIPKDDVMNYLPSIVHPYDSERFQSINIAIIDPVKHDAHLHYSTITTTSTLNNPQLTIISTDQDQKNTVHTSTTTKTLLWNEQYQEPTSVRLTSNQRTYGFDFDFEPVHLDLDLPTSDQLVGDHKGKRHY